MHSLQYLLKDVKNEVADDSSKIKYVQSLHYLRCSKLFNKATVPIVVELVWVLPNISPLKEANFFNLKTKKIILTYIFFRTEMSVVYPGIC